MKKIVIFLTVLILSKFVMANPYTPGSQSWHNWNAMAQSEADKRNAERNRQENIRRQKEAESRQREYYKNNPYAHEKIYSMIIMDENTGDVYWNLRFFIDGRISDPDKNALENMEFLFKDRFNVPAEKRDKLSFKHFYFQQGEKYVVARGRDKTNKKCDIWIMEKKKRKISEKQLTQDVLEWCNKEADNCEVILSVFK